MIRLLLVDDDEQILDTARDILEDAGYAVESATTIAEAKGGLQRGAPAVMLVDLNLKDGSGIDLARDAKSLHPAIKIVLMTGEAQVDVSSVPGVIEASLLKPVHPHALLALLKTFTE